MSIIYHVIWGGWIVEAVWLIILPVKSCIVNSKSLCASSKITERYISIKLGCGCALYWLLLIKKLYLVGSFIIDCMTEETAKAKMSLLFDNVLLTSSSAILLIFLYTLPFSNSLIRPSSAIFFLCSSSVYCL